MPGRARRGRRGKVDIAGRIRMRRGPTRGSSRHIMPRPLGAPRLGRAPAPMGLQAQPQPVVAALEAVIGHQLLVEVLGREVPVAGVEQLQHPRHLVHRRAPRREAAQAAVVETVGSLRLVAVAPAPEGALRDTQNLRSHPDGCARKPPRTSSISVPVPAPSDASPPSMAWRRSKTAIWYINRTYRVLPTLFWSRVSRTF